MSGQAIERPDAAPREGMVQSFDAGWDAHALGIGRETVRVLTANSGMALLAWDMREALAGAGE